MAYVSWRNPRLASKYKNIASLYMRHGQELGLRWDYAFFQMMVETANLTYTGDVRAKQNNFAGLGATGGGVRGESFSSVSEGVLAHLQHVLMYTGTHIDNPVADRTRKVQSWGVLNKWRKSVRSPMTFTHLAKQWAPPDRTYSRDIAYVGKVFFDKFCDRPDPDPGMLADVGGGRKKTAQRPSIKTTKTTTVSSGKLRGAGGTKTTGATDKARALAANLAQDSAGGGAGRFSAGGKTSGVNVAVLNAPKKDQLTPSASKAGAGAGSKTKTKKPGSGAATTAASKPKKTSKCKVWTASYGGPKALIIKAVKKGITNYTVLDVNVGREKREASAYIKAYAKGGATVGEFASPEKALKHAFQLCPEG